MTIEELKEELNGAIENLNDNWSRNGNVEDCFPDIVIIALENFRDSIIEYLKSNK